MKKINELRDYLLENYVDKYGDLKISGLDFSEFDGDIVVSGMKAKGDLVQNNYEVKGSLYQSWHKVGGDLYQSRHKVKGDLTQHEHDVKGNYYSSNINVIGTIIFEEHKKTLKEITAEELEKMGYKIKEQDKEKGGER